MEQFSSLFSKDKLKQGAHIHQTYDPPSSRMSWRSAVLFPADSSHICCVEHALKGLALVFFPQARGVEFYPFGTRLLSFCIAATFKACVFPFGHRLLFVRGFGLLLLLGSLINLDTLGKWSSPLIRFVFCKTTGAHHFLLRLHRGLTFWLAFFLFLVSFTYFF